MATSTPSCSWPDTSVPLEALQKRGRPHKVATGDKTSKKTSTAKKVHVDDRDDEECLYGTERWADSCAKEEWVWAKFIHNSIKLMSYEEYCVPNHAQTDYK